MRILHWKIPIILKCPIRPLDRLLQVHLLWLYPDGANLKILLQIAAPLHVARWQLRNLWFVIIFIKYGVIRNCGVSQTTVFVIITKCGVIPNCTTRQLPVFELRLKKEVNCLLFTDADGCGWNYVQVSRVISMSLIALVSFDYLIFQHKHSIQWTAW